MIQCSSTNHWYQIMTRKREERYFPPFELVRRLAKPPDSRWRQMIRGKASIKHTGYDRK